MAEGSQQNTSLVTPTTRDYDGIILFNHGTGLKYPFKYFQRKEFDRTEIRDEYYKFQLIPLSRTRILKSLKKHQKQTLSIFAKVESGRKCLRIYVCVFFYSGKEK